MSTKTNNYNLIKPGEDEFIDIKDINKNMDTIDAKMKDVENKVGAPMIATTAAEMTNKERPYVYVGSQSGYTKGNWYYWNGTAWVSGGVYNSVAVETDKTLTVEGKAADGEVVGQEIGSLKESIADNNLLLLGKIIKNSYVDEDGEIKSYNGWSRTDYIDVGEFSKIKIDINTTQDTGNFNAFFDASKKYIKKFALFGNYENIINIPDNCKYIVLSNATDKITNYKLIVKERLDKKNIAELQKKVTNISANTESLKDLLTIENKYIYKITGTLTDSDNYDCSDLIKVSQKDVLRYNLYNDPDYPVIGLYDINKNYVSDLVTGTTEGTIIVQNDGYVRLCTKKASIEYGYFLINTEYNIPSKLNNHEKRISLLETDKLPEYYNDEILTVVNDIKSHQSINSLTFAFATDLHNQTASNVRTSNANAIKSIGVLENKIPLDCVVFGGDYISNDASTTVDECNSQIENLMKNIIKLRTQKFMLRGNHDSNFLNSSDPFTDEMFYKSTNKFFEFNNNLKMNTNDLGMNVGFIDIENLKIRLIFTNMTDSKKTNNGFIVSNEQIEWFGNVALNFNNKSNKSEWGVIIFAHSYFVQSKITEGTCDISPDMHHILTAFKNGTSYKEYDFTSQGGIEVICAVVGHWHSDRSDVVDGIRIIATIQTANNGDESADDGVTYAKKWGTENETGYDYFTIDRERKKIYCTRFGIGLNREFNY